jgi:hypothetical protein
LERWRPDGPRYGASTVMRFWTGRLRFRQPLKVTLMACRHRAPRYGSDDQSRRLRIWSPLASRGLRSSAIYWLAALPTSADANHGILACQGTPTNDNQYLVEEVYNRRLVRAGATTIRDRLGEIQARVVLCGQPPATPDPTSQWPADSEPLAALVARHMMILATIPTYRKRARHTRDMNRCRWK